MTVFSGLMAAFLLISQDPQTPPPPAADPAVTDLGEVLVNSRRADEVASSFIATIGAPATSRRLARWHGAVCVSVANLSTERAQYLVDRVSTVAEDVGLQVGQPGCTANIVIVAADDAPGVANAMVEEYSRAFRPGASGMTQPLSALRDFRTSDRPVRWWHVSVPVDSESGERAVRLPGEEAPKIQVSRASRLRTDIRDDLAKVFIVIDVNRLEGANLVQLADYVAMIALAQVDAGASMSGLPTVLNLFEEPESTPGLTDWDMAYLQALYRSETSRSTTGGQASDIAGLMLRERAREE